MNELILEIYLPAALRSFDLRVPADLPLREITMLAAKLLCGMSNGLYSAKGAPLLCDRATGEILNINMTPEALGLHSGSRVMLI